MKSLKRVFVLLAVVTAVSPAYGQPLTVVAGGAQSAGANIGRTTIVANQLVSYESWNLNISNQVGADNLSGDPALTADFKAGIWYTTCSFPSYVCSGWNAGMQTVSPVAYQADPLGNTARFNATLLDSSNNQHVVNLTFTRPTSTGYGVNNPNAWVETSGSAHIELPLAGISRQGYTVSGTIDNVPVLYNSSCSPSGTCGYANATTWSQVGPSTIGVN